MGFWAKRSPADNITAAVNQQRKRAGALDARARQPLSLVKQICATLALVGIQFVWTVELTWGSPFLESLGLSKAWAALIFLAGPISNLLIQPITGALSDRCPSRFGRRKPFMVAGIFVSSLALVLLMVCRMIGGSPDDGPATNGTIAAAIVALWVLDFSINCSQTAARALVMDLAPVSQQAAINGTSAVMISVGSILGNIMGYIDLNSLHKSVALASQVQILSGAGGVIAIVTMAVTCLTTQDKPLPASLVPAKSTSGLARDLLRPFQDIFGGMRRLPGPLSALFKVQFFAFMAWFPVLFFSGKYIAEWAAQSQIPSAISAEVDEYAGRQAALAHLIYSLVNLGLQLILPFIAARLRISFRTLWCGCEVALFFVLTSTFFVSNGLGATLVIASIAIPWSIGVWVPFAIIGRMLAMQQHGHRLSDPTMQSVDSSELPTRSPTTAETPSTQSFHLDTPTNMRTPPRSIASSRNTYARSSETWSPGLVLGIHNIFMVLPQIVMGIISFGIFALLPDDKSPPVSGTRTDNIGWVYRLGGLFALVAAFLIRRMPRE